MNKVLITGSTGFIGKALVEKLNAAGEDVLSVNSSYGKIQDPKTLQAFSNLPIKHVFHLAAKTYVPHAWEDPLDLYETNVMGTLRVLEFCKERKLPLTFVSAYIYGVPESLPIAESSTINPNNPYALSKSMAEKFCKFYAETYGILTTVIRPFNVYGRGQKEHFLIPSLIKQVLNQKEIVVKDLAPKRDFIYIEDVVDALVLTMQNVKPFEIYNIGSGESFSVQEIINKIQLLAKTHKPIECLNQPRINEIPDTVAEISKAKNELNWSPSINFAEGIKRILSEVV